MEFSMSGYVFIFVFLSCFFISSGEAVNESELHKVKRQDLRHRRVIDPELIANLSDSPYKIEKRSTKTNFVDMAMFTDNSAPGKQFSVYVDSTMTRLIVEVKVDRSNPVIMVTKPSGLPGPHPKLNGTASTGIVTGTIDVAITAADYGIWKLTKLDANTWNVQVQGESPLDFSYQFLEGTLIKMPVTGDLIQGKSYTTVITVPEYATVRKVDQILEFVTEKSTPANMFTPSDLGGGKYQVASIKMPDKDFMIGIQGHDKSGNFFRRITVIKPIALILYVPSFAGVKLYENTNLDIPFTVTNKLSTNQDIYVRIKDTQRFAQQPDIISATLKPGENLTGKFVIKGGLLGVTTSVTITAKPYLGHGKVSHGPSEVRQFTVENNQTTTTSTSATTPSTVTSTASSTHASSILTTKSTANSTTSSTSFSRSAVGKVSTILTLASVKSFSAASGTSSNAPITSVVATSTNASKASLSALICGKVSVTHASASTKSVSAASGASSNATTMIKSTSATNGKVSTGHLHVKSTIPSVTHHAAVSALSSSSKTAGETTNTTPDEDKYEHFSKGEIFGASVVSGVSAGVLIGVAALVTMGLVFKHSINKGKVSPDKKKQNMLSEHDQVAWT